MATWFWNKNSEIVSVNIHDRRIISHHNNVHIFRYHHWMMLIWLLCCVHWFFARHRAHEHHNDVIISAMGFQITSPNDCLLKRLFWPRSKKTLKLRVTGLCVRGIHRWPGANYIRSISINVLSWCTQYKRTCESSINQYFEKIKQETNSLSGSLIWVISLICPQCRVYASLKWVTIGLDDGMSRLFGPKPVCKPMMTSH